MSLQDVINSIAWASTSPPWPPSSSNFPIATPDASDQIYIQLAITNLYIGSDTARSTLEAAAARGDLNFSAAGGGSQTARFNGGFNVINLDFQEIKEFRYFNDKGFVVREIFDLTLIHEIIHSEGLDDIPRNSTESDRNVGTFDFDGDTLRKQNIIAGELGYKSNKQISYAATPSLNSALESFFITDNSYSEGNTIEVARYGVDFGFGVNFLDMSARASSGTFVLFGLEFRDFLTGGNGNDYIYGGASDDLLIGGKGSDLLDGGDGTDLATYVGSRKAITIDYNGGAMPLISVKDGEGGADRLVSIETIEATQFNDNFRYNGEIPAGFTLTIDGGAGTDSANFSGAAGTNGLTIDLVAGTLTSKSTGGVIYLNNFESSLFASAYDDDITDTSSKDKWIDTGEGNNIVNLASSAGNATVYGRTGSDQITTGGGADYVLAGGVGGFNPNVFDVIKTGDGSDLIVALPTSAIIEAGAGDDYIRTFGQTGSIGYIDGGVGDDYILFDGSLVFGGLGENNTLNIKFGSSSGRDTVVQKNVVQSEFGGYYNIITSEPTSSISFVWDAINPNNSGFGNLVVRIGSASLLLPRVFGYRSGTRLVSASVAINGSIVPLQDIHLTIGSVAAYRGDLTSFNAAARPDPSDLVGGNGNDNLQGGSTDDAIDGGGGDDNVIASAGNDIVDGGTGDDTLQFFSARVNYDFTEIAGEYKVKDNRTGDITTISNIENLSFLEDAETIKFEDAFGYVGTVGNDFILGSVLNNTISGLAGNDVLDGGQGYDTAIFSGALSDYTISRSSGGLTVVTGTGAGAVDGIDTLSNIEALYFKGDAQQFDLSAIAIQGTAQGEIVNGTSENDIIIAGSGDDHISGLGGDNFIDGGEGIDRVLYSGNSTDYSIVREEDGTFLVKDKRAAARDYIDYVQDVEAFYFAGDNVTVLLSEIPAYGSISADVIVGSVRPDELYGFEGDDILSGGDGDDLIYGGDGADQLLGNGGNDRLIGGIGNDTLNGGAGSDETSFNGLQSGYTIVRQFNGSVTVSDIDESDGSDGVDTLIDVETISFAGSATSVRISDIALNGTSTPDTIQGSSGDDTIDGKLGDDVLFGNAGNDTIRGDAGNDLIRFSGSNEGFDNINGGAGIDTIQAISNDTKIGLSQINEVEAITSNGFNNVSITGSGNSDTLNFANVTLTGIIKIKGGTGNDVITGSGAADTIYGGDDNDTLFGGGGNDTLYGEFSNDILNGGAGDDFLSGGWGNDQFQHSGSSNGFDSVNGGQGTDLISALTNSTVIGLTSISGVETISANGFANVTIAGSVAGDTLDFGAVTLSGISSISGGAGNDIITGSIANDLILGGTENDTLSGGQGDDTLNGGLGTNILDGGVGTDVAQYAFTKASAFVVLNANGSYTLTATGISDTITNIENVNFTDGTFAIATLVSSGQTLNGTSATDTLNGSPGDDTITGLAGDDTLNGNGGNDLFRVTGTTDGFDIVDGGAGTDTIAATANNAVIGLTSVIGVEVITAGSFTGVSILGSATNNILNFALTTLTGITLIDGGAGSDTITGNSSANTIRGSGGDDIIDSGDGNDTIQYTGTANGFDTVNGGLGTDTILALANSTVIGLTSVTGVEVISAGSFTVVSILGSASNDTLNLSGVTLTAITLIDGGAGNDTITGNMIANTIRGSAGDDVIDAGDGNDTIQYTGTANGFDAVNGGLGADTISALANATVIGLSSLAGIETISAGTFTGVYIAGSGGNDTLNFSSVTLTNIVRVEGGAGNDSLTGNAAINTLWGGLGNDRIDGGAGNDTLLGDDGDDTLIGGAGNDVLNGGVGIDTVYYSAATANLTVNLATTAAQTIKTGESDTISNVENVIGGSGADTITGSTLANNLNAGAGNDRIRGGLGNDTITGGLGADVAVFAGLQASYSIVTNAGTITVVDNQATTDGNDGTDTLIGVERAEFKGGVQVALAAPIVLDLNGDGVALVDQSKSKAKFDWDGDGKRDKTGWVGKGDGLLVYDRNGDGTVSGADELSFIDDKEGAKSDLDGLSTFDSNGDGLFSEADEKWASFRIWKDNGNGKVDKRELISLADAGVASITLAGQAVNRTYGWNENITVNTGTFTRTNGTSGALGDVALRYAPTSKTTIQSQPVQAFASQLAEAIAGFDTQDGGLSFDTDIVGQNESVGQVAMSRMFQQMR